MQTYILRDDSGREIGEVKLPEAQPERGQGKPTVLLVRKDVH